MFGSLTVNDDMVQVLGRLFRVPVNGKPITILELTGLPTEIVNVVVAVLCRMTFDFALWSEGKIPVTLVCEEAHRYVPANPSMGFEPCKRAIARIAKEGRKYGASLCIVTQRPAEIDPTILSQCNTVFALRMSNDRDQQIVTSAISDTGSGLLEFLSALGQREAIAFGDGVSLPVRIRFDELPQHAMPRSSTARFSERWQKSLGDDGFLEQIVEKWRLSSSGAGGESGQQAAMFADALSLADLQPGDGAGDGASEAEAVRYRQVSETASVNGTLAEQFGPVGGMPRQGSGNGRREPSNPRRDPVAPAIGSGQTSPQPGTALRSLRERLTQRPPSR
jgi:DNA helicase HerA-like ATPase